MYAVAIIDYNVLIAYYYMDIECMYVTSSSSRPVTGRSLGNVLCEVLDVLPEQMYVTTACYITVSDSLHFGNIGNVCITRHITSL